MCVAGGGEDEEQRTKGRGRGGQEDTVAPEGAPFFEVALSSFPSKWSGV